MQLNRLAQIILGIPAEPATYRKNECFGPAVELEGWMAKETFSGFIL
jgi:hypothetical protein